MKEMLEKDYNAVYFKYGYGIRSKVDVKTFTEINEDLTKLEHIADKYITIVDFIEHNVIGKVLLKRIMKKYKRLGD